MDNLTGQEFQTIVSERNTEYRKEKRADVGSYGVRVNVIGNVQHEGRRVPLLQQMKSLPDFEGVVQGGMQLIFDAKVCSQSSFDLNPYDTRQRKPKALQLSHMLRRSEFGVVCFFLIHWNAREGASFSHPPATYVFPVEHGEYWDAFVEGRSEKRSINRADCEEFGLRVRWNKMTPRSNARPDYLEQLENLMLKRIS